jgi:large subunit ribosomal protein L10
MGRTLANKQQIVEELKGLLGEAEMALVLDYQGLSIKEMSDLRTRLQASNGVCKVTKNTLMRRAIDGDSAWSDLDSLLTGTNAFVLVRGDVGGAVKAVQSFQKDTKKSEVKGGLFEGRLLSQNDIKAIGDLPSREVLMAQIAGAINGVATKLAGHQRGALRSRPGARPARRLRRRLRVRHRTPPIPRPSIQPICC